MACIFGIDIGGTDIKIGQFEGQTFIRKIIIPTNTEHFGRYILDDVFRKTDELAESNEILGIGIGVPGPVSEGVVLGAQNIGWETIRAEEIIRSRYPKAQVKVLNDANAAALGEMAAGGARKYRSFVFVTLGTGIGGGIVINGSLIEGNTGSTGEIGHLRVGFGDVRKCTCGLYDCVEQYASATGVVITANLLRKNRKTILNGMEVTSKSVFEAAKAKDAVALETVDMMVEKLATALAAVADTVNPQAFVIGGGVSKAGNFLLERLEKRFRELAFYSVRNTEFVLAELGNDAGIYGAAYSVRAQK
jgi:glucokinase